MTSPNSQPEHAEENDVKDTLTSKRRAGRRSDDGRPTRPRARSRRRTPVENTDYAAFATRVIRAHAHRIADGDVEGLAELVALAHEVDTATQTAVNGLRAFGYSWGNAA